MTKPMSREDITIFLELISNKSVKHGSGKMPAYIKGYLISVLEEFTSLSPAVKKSIKDQISYEV